ncbi:MAG: acyltransferase family protein [Actinobacteria bacterium]|uniref:Unannotated protein n=1 Tax=freshwater metagenome TaxID=449393 RepID=A0A6J7DRY6_9ZZZZ|nr:acyltransferase family protein [Actinomycetota bacterium]
MSTLKGLQSFQQRLTKRPDLHAGRFPYMDSLRALAAFSIVIFHFAGYAALPPEMDWLRPLQVRLGAGVLVFFVISGFLIYRPFVRANLEGGSRPETAGYAKRRFLRIVPAYFLALTVTAALAGKSDVFGPDGFLYYGFAQIYSPGLELRGLSVAWSLCIEATLYAFLPIWALFVGLVPARTAVERHRREISMLVLLIALGVATRIILSNTQGRVGAVSILAYLDIFALGMLLAYFSVAWEGRKLPSWLGWLNEYPGIAWALAALCIWAMATQTGPNRSAFQHAMTSDLWLRHGLSAAVGVLLVIPLAFGDQTKGTLRRVLSQPWFLWAGVVSYGVYLFHPIVLKKLKDAGAFPTHPNILEWWGMLLLVAAITAGIAAISWHLLERPLINLKNTPLLSKSRPALPQTAQIAIGIGGLAMIATGIFGTDYVFIDFVLVASGAVLAAAALIPANRPRPASSLLAGIGAVAVAFAIVPGLLTLSAPAPAKASTSAFPQRAYLAGTVGNGRIQLFLNGKVIASGPAPKNLKPSKSPFEIGGVTGGHGWSGSLDSVGVWDQPLSQDALRKQFLVGANGKTGSVKSVMHVSDGLVRWYGLGDIGKGVKDRASGTHGKVVGTVGQSPNHVAPGDHDGGAAKFLGKGRISTPPLLNVSPSNFTVATWVQTGASISDRTVAGVQGAWLLKTDISGHWTFGVKQGKAGYTVVSRQTAQRFVPGAAQQARIKETPSGVSLGGLLAGLLVLGAGLLLIPSVRRRVVRFTGSLSKR